MELELYKRMLQAEGGSIANANVVNTTNAINASFTDSPFYINGFLQDQPFEWQVISGTSSKDQMRNKQFLFRPHSTCNIGDYLVANGDTWIVIDKNYLNPIFPKATVLLCTQILRWSSGSVLYEYPCAFSDAGKSMGVEELDSSAFEKTGEYSLYCQYNAETKLIKQDQRLIFGRNAFKVVDVDDLSYTFGDKGLLKITVEYDLKKDGETDVASDRSKFQIGEW